MRVDHIGYAVKSIEKAKSLMGDLGFTFEETIEDSARDIYIAFGEMDGYRIELVAPINICAGGGIGQSPVDAFIKNGPTPYHVCYRSNAIEADIERLTKSRFKVVTPLAPAIAFGGKRVVFMYSLSIGLVEIVEE